MKSRARDVLRSLAEEYALNLVSQSISGWLPRALARRVLASAWRAAALLLALPLLGLGAVAEEQKPADAAAPSTPGTPPAVDIKIHYLAKAYDEPPLLSLVDPILTDNGVQGARRAIADNNKSGAFLGQKYELIEDLLPADGDVVAKDKEILSKGPALPPQEAGCGPAGRTRGCFHIAPSNPNAEARRLGWGCGVRP